MIKTREGYIVGSGGLAKEVENLFTVGYTLSIFEDIDVVFSGFLDENIKKCGDNIYPLKEDSYFNLGTSFIVAIGDPRTKERIAESLMKKMSLMTLIHKNSIVKERHRVGLGTIIFPNVVLTANNKIGKCCTIYSHTSICHDTTIGDYCNITPGVQIAGRCKIGNRVYLGIGCVISNDVTICDDVIVGAGATVIESITEPGTYVGTPARKVK